MRDQLIPVPFRDATLYLIGHEAQPFVAMKPIVEGLGLDWKTQFRKLSGDARYGHMTIPLPTPSGNQATLCLPLRKLNGWLFGISPAKVKPELRETIIAYQDECFEALYQYWHNGFAGREGAETAIEADFGGEEATETLAGPPASPFEDVDPSKMRELRRVNPTLAQAYLVSLGITPAYVDGLMSTGGLLPAPAPALANVAPLAVLQQRVSQIPQWEDEKTWYFERAEWVAVCGGFDPLATARWLKDRRLLRVSPGEPGRLSVKTWFTRGGQRLRMLGVLKTLLQHGLSEQPQQEKETAHEATY